ncbi:MAG: FAD-binding protein [Alphaproteobacteria bacterium]|nr:FAD-binding protein [Alphaproteobacteria bacterium]
MRKSIQKPYDVVIAGGGLAGLTMATRLGSAGLRILVVEQQAHAQMLSTAFDGRSTAIAYGSSRILDACGVWDKIKGESCPIEDIRVADQHSPITLDFESGKVGNNAFGYIVENTKFRAALFERIAEIKTITLACPAVIENITYSDTYVTLTLDDGSMPLAQLLIAADGKKSFCREHAGIKARHWSYNETALVVTIAHSAPHHNLALEYFFPGGPFAVLPMTNNRSSIVWTEKPDTAAALQTMAEAEFVSILKERGCGELGDITCISPRQLYPLRFMLADTLHAPRLALIGEAAHAMHPVAGQGFNLSVRDIGVLGDLIEQRFKAGGDVGTDDLLQRYAAGRYLDHFTFMTATDVLVKLFSNNVLPLRLARRFGLGMVAKIPAAKSFFSKMAMGLLT